MATETLTTLEKALKIYYLGPVVKQLDEGSGPIMAALEKGSKYLAGKEFRFPLQYGRSGGVGARAEDGDLPTPAARKWAQGSAGTKNLFARFQLTDKLLKTSKDSKVSFADQVTQMMQDLVVDGNDMLRRNLVGSSSGQIALVNGAVSSSTDVVIDTGSINAFYPGQILDFGTSASTAGLVVADVDYDNNKIILSAAASISDNTAIYLAGNKDKELTGIADIMSNSNTIYGINRSSNKWYVPIMKDHQSSGADQELDSLWMQEMIDLIEDRCGDKPNFIACTNGMRRAYIDEQNTYKRNLETKKVDGGYELVSYGGVAISPEKYMLGNRMDFLNTKFLYLGQLADWEWMDEDGAIMHRVTGKAAYEGSLVKYAELLCTKPVAQGRMTGIVEH